MYDPEGVSNDSIEDFVTISEKWHNPNAWPLHHEASTQRQFGDTRDDFLYARCNAFCDGGVAGASVIGGNLPKIGDGSLRIFDPHVFRNIAKAALTSSLLAASPASPSSIAANSSGVAL